MSSHIRPVSDVILATYLQLFENATPRTIDTTIVQISRFPLHVREKRARDIRPRVVSIGPFFHGDPDFEKMEIKKLEFVRPIRDDTQALCRMIQKVESFVEQARKCYSERIELNNDDFARMLLVDSCFIISFLTSLFSEMEKRQVVSLDWSIKEIGSDLLLLENQVPLFVVHEMYLMFKSSFPAYHELPGDFRYILGPFIRMNMTWGHPEPPKIETASHLLHYYWLCFLPNKSHGPPSDTKQPNQAEITITVNPNPAEATIPLNTFSRRDSTANLCEEFIPFDFPTNIPSATELYRVARVTFKSSRKDGFVTRFRHGTMEMSSLKIDETRKIILTNLVGFEKSLKLSDRKVSSYLSLMDSLINTEEDVALLQKRGIFFNGLNSNAAAAEFFNEIGNMCTISYRHHRFANLFKNVNEYYNSPCTRRWAILRHNYLSSSWAAISVSAAGLLLLLTVIQTILGGIQTHYAIHPSNPS